MAKKIIKAQMKQRTDTKANWASSNPVLLKGELGIVSDDPNLYKVGDGATAWNALPFRGFNGTVVNETGTSETAVMSQKAVTEKLTELSEEIFVDYEEYMGTIAELHIIAPRSENGYLAVKQYNNYIYVRYTDGSSVTSTSWQVQNSIANIQNDEIVPLTCTTASETLGVKVGDIIGYIIFKNIDKFKLSSVSVVGKQVFESKCRDISYSPIIKSVLVSRDAINQGFSELSDTLEGKFSSEIFETAEQYFDTIAELYIVAPTLDADLLVKSHNRSLYVRFGSTSSGVSSQSWQCMLSLTDKLNGNVYTLTCTTASETLGVKVGDIVGYIIFKDVDVLKTMTDTSAGKVVYKDKCIDFSNNPIIFSYINQSNDIAVTDITLSKGVNITLPSKLTAIVGDNMQIFWRSIISASNPYIFDIYAVSLVGKSYPRYYEFKPTADMVGNSYALLVYVKANNGTIIASKNVTIEVVDNMTAPSSTKNILCIGASATAGGQWVGELKRRLTDTSGDGTSANPTGLGLSNIAFVGRKEGTSNPINLEATGGWKVQDYASKGQSAVRFFVEGVDTIAIGARYSCNGTNYVVQEVNVTEGEGNIRCTLENTFVTPSGKLTKLTGGGDVEITFTSYNNENFSPFWNANEEKIDFMQYADSYCDGKIDCLIWHCGVNDLTSGDSAVIPNVIVAFRNLLNSYHEQFPQGKVIISSVPIGSVNGGFAANYGANESLNYYTFAKITQLYAQALVDLTKEDAYNGFTLYAPVLEEFDAENGYPIKQTAVNNRSSVTEVVGTNGVHPTTEGSYMVADAIYRTFNNLNL